MQRPKRAEKRWHQFSQSVKRKQMSDIVQKHGFALNRPVFLEATKPTPTSEGESLAEGARLKAVASHLAKRWGVPKRDVYQGLLALQREVGGA